ncbi:hypothetical protein C8Q80DRAFT_189666 [Daedaleopsis nitida]|nr:hypothetical protein C8Q80DRAFT_189666 [Daedaleopsis nitida]
MVVVAKDVGQGQRRVFGNSSRHWRVVILSAPAFISHFHKWLSARGCWLALGVWCRPCRCVGHVPWRTHAAVAAVLRQRSRMSAFGEAIGQATLVRHYRAREAQPWTRACNWVQRVRARSVARRGPSTAPIFVFNCFRSQDMLGVRFEEHAADRLCPPIYLRNRPIPIGTSARVRCPPRADRKVLASRSDSSALSTAQCCAHSRTRSVSSIVVCAPRCIAKPMHESQDSPVSCAHESQRWAHSLQRTRTPNPSFPEHSASARHLRQHPLRSSLPHCRTHGPFWC